MARVTGLAVTAFSVASTDYVAAFVNGTLHYENKTVESKAAKDAPDFPWIVGYKWSIEAEVDVQTVASLVTAAAAGLPIAISANSGANTYSGNAVLNADHSFGREDLQKEKITLMGQGELTIA